jgi:hypothetical protein
MPRYAITEKAGRFVAGTNNTGVGTVLNLTEKQAEHEVRLGALRPLDGPKPEPVEQEPKAQTEEPTQALAGSDGATEPTGGEPEKAPKQAAKGAKK